MNLNSLEEKSSMGSSSTCTAVSTESGTICGERNSLQILDEFRRLYETRVNSIDPNNTNAQELKIKIMEEWIRDLDAQNTMLVKTVQELEEAAYERVKILEDKLKHTSTLLTENMSRFEQPTHHRLDDLSERIDFLKTEDDYLKEKIKNLRNDITGLLELLRRAYYEHRWNIEGITFHELTQADIPISFNCDDESINESSSSVGKDLTGMSDDNHVQSLRQSEKFTQVNIDSVEMINLKEELRVKRREIEQLRQQLNAVEKEVLETRDALTLEVADKHDQTVKLKKQVAVLEEQCRNTNQQVRFKDDIIKEMRNELKFMKSRNSSPTQTRFNQTNEPRELTWGGVTSDESTEHSESDSNLTNLKNMKTIMKKEQYELMHLKNQLKEVLDTLNINERKTYEKGLVDAHRKLQDMENLLETYNTQNNVENCGKCAEKSFNVSRDDFNIMEEFRVCTVEAQAATEDMREEMASVICNLDSRHQLFMNLKNTIDEANCNIIRSEENVSIVIKYLKDQIEEKNVSKETIISGESKLKDLKNEINECLVRFKLEFNNNDTLPDKKKLTDSINHFCNNLMDKVIVEIEYILCNLGVFITKEDSNCQTLLTLNNQLHETEKYLNELREHNYRVLQDNDAGKCEYEEKSKKLDKLERELDDAHTRMQDHLENIVLRSQLQMNQSTPCDVHHTLQKQIDAQMAVINEHLEQKKYLLEQSKLQNETIKHLQKAVVDAKKNYNHANGQKEKSTIELAVSDVWTSITPTVFNNGDVQDI